MSEIKTVADLFKEKYIRYSWQGYKDGKEVPKATGYYTIRGFHTPNMWNMMVEDIKEHLQTGKVCDEAVIKREWIMREKRNET
jgi:hypothetical protein